MTPPRRIGQAIRLLALALLIDCAVLAPVSAAQDTPARFDAPQTEMLLTRVLSRTLPDGNMIVARRSYAVKFEREGGGFRVNGRLIDVNVDAPPSLRQLAELERLRPDKGMFPIRLDSDGMIVEDDPPEHDEAVERAATVAAARIGTSGLSAIDSLQAQAFIRQMRSRPPGSRWPADLFRPVANRKSETRSVPLPGGMSGQVVIEIDAQSSASTGLLASFDRTVTTDLQGDKRVTHERWTLSHAVANSER